MNKHTTSERICKVESTDDTLTGRGGLAIFNRYLCEVGVYEVLEGSFGHFRKSAKGLDTWRLFKQVFLFFFDGTSRHLTYFDELKKDKGYAGTVEERVENLASSHTIKRFFKLFFLSSVVLFRQVLRRLFLWRLKIEQPDEIELTVDTMVMDNDEANAREGVQPTYKKVKGFQPLQIVWDGRIVDAIFRGGKKHGNGGKTVINMVKKLVDYIRKNYRKDVTIVVKLDSAFFDEANFALFDELGIGFIATGKMYKGVKEAVRCAPDESWGCYDNTRQAWSFSEFGYRPDSWGKFYRAIYTRPVYDDKQMLLDFARPDNVIITNIGVNTDALIHCDAQRRKYWMKATTIIRSHHMRGADELPHRGLKDFGFEQLPFKRFAPNCAFFYCMIIAFFLFECFKRDVLREVIPISSYANTVRRKLVDFAAKIVKTSKQIILKIPRSVMSSLKIESLWNLCQNPPPIPA
jgi:hypothetical protein